MDIKKIDKITAMLAKHDIDLWKALFLKKPKVLSIFNFALENNLEFDKEQLELLYKWITLRKYPIAHIKAVANPRFTVEQLKYIELGLSSPISFKVVQFYANPDFSIELMEEVLYESLLMPLYKIKVFAKIEFSKAQRKVIREVLKYHIFPYERATMVAHSEFDAEQMQIIWNDMKKGVDLYLIETYASHVFTKEEFLRTRKKVFEKKVTSEFI